MLETLDIASPACRLIINADDLGACSERDAGILELFSRGAITSASLLVNGPSAVEAAASASAASLPLGLHLNLSEGRLANRCSLTDANGKLLGKLGLRRALAAGVVRDDDLAREIREQFEAFIALTGELPSHVDGHHHIHVEPAVAQLLAGIMSREYGVYCARLPREGGLGAMAVDADFDAGFQLAVVAAAAAAEPVFAAEGIYSTAAFLGQSLMGFRLQPAPMATALRALTSMLATRNDEALWVELMVHPGLAGSADADNSKHHGSFCCSPARAHEMAMLQSTEWRDVIAGWKPGSFRELPRPLAAADARPNLLIYSKLTPATGNAETARRYAAAWSAQANVRMRPVPVDIGPAALAREAMRLRQFAKRERLDLAVGIHMLRAGAPLAAAFSNVAADTCPLPYGLLASGTDANADIDLPEHRQAIGTALAQADFLLCLNEEQKLRLSALPRPADITVLGNGIDVTTASNFSLRGALKLAAQARLILFPASLRRLKGVLPLIERLATPLAEIFRDHVLVVLGPALEASYAAELRARLETLVAGHPTLEGRIVLHAGLPHGDYLAALKEATLVLNASEHEGLSHGLMEAMAAGVPVLARDIPGNRQLIRDGENGRLFADFAALPAAYAACFAEPETSTRMAECARTDIARRFPADAERQALVDLLARTLARRQTMLPFAGVTLRLDRTADTHPVSAENLALFAQLALSPAALRDWPLRLPRIADIGCGCGVFGLRLLETIAASGRRVENLLFTDPHSASLAALTRTLTRHRAQLTMLDRAELDDGSLLAPLRRRGERVQALSFNLPQTPGPQGFRLDRSGGADGAELICRLLAELPEVLADDGEAFLLHIGLAHPARVRADIAAIGFCETVVAEQTRHASFADYEALHSGLADYLRAEHAAGRAEFVPDASGEGFTYRARLVRLRRAPE